MGNTLKKCVYSIFVEIHKNGHIIQHQNILITKITKEHNGLTRELQTQHYCSAVCLLIYKKYHISN